VAVFFVALEHSHEEGPMNFATSKPTGRELALTRLVMGVSVYAVSRALRVQPQTLDAWEKEAAPLDEDRCKRWEAALGVCARDRARYLERHGFATGDLPSDLSLRRVLAYYG
jgi:hypothetical protein